MLGKHSYQLGHIPSTVEGSFHPPLLLETVVGAVILKSNAQEKDTMLGWRGCYWGK